MWYRFFHTIWQQVTSGTPSTTTLQGAHDTASDALAAANAASAAVVAERTRAQLVEGALQNAITTLNGQVTSLQATVTALEATTTSLQNQINVINSRLAAAGIP